VKRGLILLVASLVAILVLAAGSAAQREQEECTWGASSVIVEQVDGTLVQSEPATSGCIPPP
jgi:hypothetical protein